MRRWASTVVAIALGLGALGCGQTTTEREAPVTIKGTPPARGEAGTAAPRGTNVRIWVVTHGQASSAFWAIVRNGVDAAARQVDADVTYRAPDVYSLQTMVALIDQAVAAHPDGLVVSLPEAGLAPTIRRAVAAGIPVVTINSGSDMYAKLGVLAHVGQPEDVAGYKSGRRLAAAGVRRAVCVNLKIVNVGLDARCAGLARAMREAGGRSTMIRIDDVAATAPGRIARAVRAAHADGVLACNAVSGLATVQALRGTQGVTAATFDLGPDVLAAVKRGRLAFAVDQQGYLQGYLPVVLLAERARYGLFPAQGEVIPTGPNFVTARTAGQAIALARRSIR
ncbi:sugar ABC transporter substrate-binding protein [Baekduia soli]|uniref:Sugar ABC transporter substrate-binding protein n=1 Tax=Baekduia soli TaxID=496014 RepID=A0A5B8U4I1_9ACTN|nr:substrate-binding domain-containing protein [Baekduia soli]QEC47877.1 sugar ABC transporter substrate-binding protein [Baekduia soli]